MQSDPQRHAHSSNESESSNFRQLGEDVLHESWFRLVRAQFEAPDGRTFSREVVRHPGAVSVVPVLDDGNTVLLVRQFRAALGTYLLEIPAGKRDVDGEDPVTTAHRELVEEVGMTAGSMEPLCEFFNAPGFADERQCLFLARDLVAVESDAQGIEEEHMTVERVSLSDLPQLMSSATIRDAKTIIGLLLARDWLASKSPA